MNSYLYFLYHVTNIHSIRKISETICCRCNGNSEGVFEDISRGVQKNSKGANIDKNYFFEILDKMSQKGGGRRTVPPSVRLYGYEDVIEYK